MGGLVQIKKGVGEDTPFFLAVASRGRGTAAHIRGRNPAAAPRYAPMTAPAVVLRPQSRSRALVFNEKGT